MYNFILQICSMVGFGGMVYMIARGTPRIDDRLEEKEKSKLDRWFSKIPIEKIDITLSNFLEKFLRRLRVYLLRMDNFLAGRLNKIKSATQLNNKKSDLLQAIASKKTEENDKTKAQIEEVKEEFKKEDAEF